MREPARVLLAAGGTGGHVFPAEALAGELLSRGHHVALVTDRRGGGFGERLPAVETHRIATGGLAGTGLVGRAQGVVQLGLGFFQARALIGRLKPDVVVGFGGYPSVPPLLAASLAGIPTVLHEQNALLGRANRLLARRATRIATSFEGVEGAPTDRVILTGNPVRPAIAAVGQAPYPQIEPGGRIDLLVLGGSQGARVFSRLIPEAVALLPEGLQRRLHIAQQARAEDMESARAGYAKLAAKVELSPFFADVPDRLRAAHLVIARAGASTVAELTAAGRPAILVPYPYATDDHQTANATKLNMSYAALVMPEASTSAADLAAALRRLVEGSELPAMARAAQRLGRPDAAARLADLVVSLVRGNGARQEAAA
jgi:UDP-N-acetylglucosamine--N-acetylmuramyl-(pentapeptide) pyrophosphoryl-undecaprenol N-acetylglucosamine transferase